MSIRWKAEDEFTFSKALAYKALYNVHTISKQLNFVKIVISNDNMIALDLIITESSICLRDFSGIYEAQETDAFQTL